MIVIHQGNRLESLAEDLVERLRRWPAGPLAPRWVVVPNPGMGRWLVQHMALRTGVAANLDLPLPASFFWRVLRAWLPDEVVSPFDRDVLHWRIMDVLMHAHERPVFAPLRRYVEGGKPAPRLFQLAGRIADLFDQYLVFRPELVLAWERGAEPHDWQAQLWHELAREAPGHRARLLERLLSAMDAPPKEAGALPETIFFFGLNALPPIYLEILRGLGRHRALHLYHLNPCREYWADLRAPREHHRREAPQAAFLDVGNPLLASMGHVGQVFLDQLLGLEADVRDRFQEPEGMGVLHRIQKDLLDLVDGRDAPEPLPEEAWPSLQFHGVHSRMREVQVLHDNLLRCFEAFDGLAPHEILVMAPDMTQYAPFVEAVFGTAEGARFIPFSMDGRRSGVVPMAEAVRWLLRLPDCRFPASEVLAFLEVDAVQRRFGLDGEALERIRAWVRESGIRWSLDGDQRRALSLPDMDGLHSWRFGLRRLFVGFAAPVEDDDTLYPGEVAPYVDVEGGELLWVGGLQSLVEALDLWRRRLDEPQTPDRWQALLAELMDTFFQPGEADQTLLLDFVRTRLDALAANAEAAGFRGAVPVDVVRQWVETDLDTVGGAHGPAEGGVMFSNLVPMRALPYRVIALLGMNDREFPRRQPRPAFDRMGQTPRRTDRDRRRDDRYLFLETLVSARDCLIVSWLSRDARTDEPRLPAETVTELMDYLDGRFNFGEEKAAPSKVLFVQHRLQPFDSAYYDGRDVRLFSHDPNWCVERGKGSTASFLDGFEPNETPPERATVEELIAFFRNPAQAFLEQVLKMRLPREAALVEDTEPLDYDDRLMRWQLAQSALDALVEGADPEETERLLRAQGRLLPGTPGRLAWKAALVEARAVYRRLRPMIESARPQAPLPVELRLNGFHLAGEVEGFTGQGVLDWRPGQLRAGDVLSLWIRHLAVAAAGEAVVASHFVTSRQTLLLDAVGQTSARERLEDLAALYREGLSRPLLLPPRTAWARAREEGRWLTQWEGHYRRPGERDDPAHALLFRDGEALDEAFEARALRLFEPLLESCHLEETAA